MPPLEIPLADKNALPPPAWDERSLQNPHAVLDKRRRVQAMFAAIAPSYDLNNRLHSLGIDQRWRRKAVEIAAVDPGQQVVDVACGTGDLAMAFGVKTDQVIGIDFTLPMLPIARRKAPGLPLINGDAQALPLPDQSADVVSIAFGIRNVADPAVAMAEFFRVLRPGGRLIVLEFSLPTHPLLRSFYNFYFRRVMPRTATLLSGDRTGAYHYLPESVNTFIGRPQMVQMMQAAGFVDVEQHPMTFGVCVCYRGVRRV